MKKQIKKLTICKRTISNLDIVGMSRYIGGNPTNGAVCPTDKAGSGTCTFGCTWDCKSYWGTCEGHTCHGHNCQ